MSRYRTGDCDIKSMTSLILALDEMGFSEVEVFETQQVLQGFQGDDREETAHVIIRRQHVGGMSNDIGFRMEANGTWKAIVSDYDQRRYPEAWLTKVATLSALHEYMETARKRGQKAVRKTLPSGEEEVRVYV